MYLPCGNFVNSYLVDVYVPALAVCLRFVWEFRSLPLVVVEAELEATCAVLAAPDTGCPGRTAGYLEFLELQRGGKSG